MLKSMATVEEPFTEQELTLLVQHMAYNDITSLDGNFVDGVEILRGMYEKVPDAYKHTGVIYRGLMLDNAGVLHFLENKEFDEGWAEEEKSKENLTTVKKGPSLVSWTTRQSKAISYAERWGAVARSLPFGIVLQSDTSQKDVVMEFNTEIYRMVKEQVPDPSQIKNLDAVYRIIDEEKTENEVMVLKEGRQMYTMCQDVIAVVIDAYEFLYYPRDTTYKEAFLAHVEEGSQARTQEKMESRSAANEYRYMIYTCDGNGMFELVKEET